MKRVLIIALLLFCSCMLFGQTTCYQGTRSKGVAFYNQKQYEKAAKAFAAAKVCPDKPANNDIDAWIAKCKTQEEAQAKQEQARQQELARQREQAKSKQQKIIEYPTYSSSMSSDLIIKKITLTNAYTAIEFRSKFTHYAWCQIYPETYIVENGRYLTLKRAEGISISPNTTNYNYRDVVFTLYFPPISISTTQIDFIEPGESVWKIYGISLRKSNSAPYTPSSSSTASQSISQTPAGYTDLGLPSGTKWKNYNESGGFYTYEQAVNTFGNRLPSKAQWEELKNKCRWQWTGSGYKVTGPNGNSITLPAAGYRGCSGGTYYVGSTGYYWSSTPNGSDEAWGLGFGSGGVCMGSSYRCSGRSVRLVQD